jgi:hypothetical protein
MPGLFSRDLTRIRGTLQALLEAQRSVEVLGEHRLAGRMADYPLIVVAECDSLEPPFRRELVAYAEGGGSLLLVGPSAAAMFASELGVSVAGAPRTEERYLAYGGALMAVKGPIAAVEAGSKARPFGLLHAGKDPGSPSVPAASIAALGRGRIAAIYFPFSRAYLEARSEAARAFLDDLARQLFPEPLVEVKGSPDVDVAVQRIGGRLAVNLINTAGPHAEPRGAIQDSIPPVGPLEVTIRTKEKPRRVTVEPGGEPILFQFRDGAARLSLPRLEVHAVLLVE